jgi:hypothetical protein
MTGRTLGLMITLTLSLFVVPLVAEAQLAARCHGWGFSRSALRPPFQPTSPSTNNHVTSRKVAP